MDRRWRVWSSAVRELLHRPLTKLLLGGALLAAIYHAVPFLALLLVWGIGLVLMLKLLLRGLHRWPDSQ